MISSKSGVIFCILLLGQAERSISAPTGSRNDPKSKEEATKIALESTGELIAQPEMVEKIKSDLQLIRFLDKSLVKRTHTGKWNPGEIIARGITDEQVMDVQGSEFKPVRSVLKNSLDTILVFAKPYHPEQLSRLLKLRFGFDSKPNMIQSKDGQGDQILYRDDLSTYYWNSVNGKDCEKGCLAQYAVSVDTEKEEFGLNSLYA